MAVAGVEARSVWMLSGVVTDASSPLAPASGTRRAGRHPRRPPTASRTARPVRRTSARGVMLRRAFGAAARPSTSAACAIAAATSMRRDATRMTWPPDSEKPQIATLLASPSGSARAKSIARAPVRDCSRRAGPEGASAASWASWRAWPAPRPTARRTGCGCAASTSVADCSTTARAAAAAAGARWSPAAIASRPTRTVGAARPPPEGGRAGDAAGRPAASRSAGGAGAGGADQVGRAAVGAAARAAQRGGQPAQPAAAGTDGRPVAGPAIDALGLEDPHQLVVKCRCHALRMRAAGHEAKRFSRS